MKQEPIDAVKEVHRQADADSGATRALLARLRGGGHDAASAASKASGRLLTLVGLAALAGAGLAWLGQAWLAAGIHVPVQAAAEAKAGPIVTAFGAQAPAAAGAAVALEGSGFVVARRQATVSASMTGRLARLLVAEGARVRQSDLIAELDTGIPASQVAFAQAGVQAAERAVEVTRRRLAVARRSAERDQDLANQGYISSAQLDQSRSQAETLQAQIEVDLSQVRVAQEQQRLQQEQMANVRVRAPFDGMVTGLAAHEGEVVSPISGGGGFTRTGICTIVDLRSLEGEVDVNERYLARLRVGQRVTVRLPAYPAIRLEGQVADLPASIDRNTAAARVRITFTNPAPELRPGMRAEFAFAALP